MALLNLSTQQMVGKVITQERNMQFALCLVHVPFCDFNSSQIKQILKRQ